MTLNSNSLELSYQLVSWLSNATRSNIPSEIARAVSITILRVTLLLSRHAPKYNKLVLKHNKLVLKIIHPGGCLPFGVFELCFRPTGSHTYQHGPDRPGDLRRSDSARDAKYHVLTLENNEACWL